MYIAPFSNFSSHLESIHPFRETPVGAEDTQIASDGAPPVCSPGMSTRPLQVAPPKRWMAYLAYQVDPSISLLMDNSTVENPSIN